MKVQHMFLYELLMGKNLWCLQEAVVTARFSAISTGTMVDGVWYKPVEQFILPKVSFHINSGTLKMMRS